MLSKKYPIVVATVIAALVAFVMPLAARQAGQPLNIGVIGPYNGSTAEGVSLALKRFSSQSALTTPDGATHTLSVIAIDATTPQEVADAITTLKNNNVIAIFGPSDDQLVMDSMAVLQAAAVPIFTGATGTAVKGGGLIFRTRAADNWRMTALADYMLTDLKMSKFAVYQSSDIDTGAVRELVSVLTSRGKPPSLPVMPKPDETLTASAKSLMGSAPEAIIAFGNLLQTAELYRTLRGADYRGIFVTPNAALRGFVDELPESLRPGIYGVAGWSYSAEDTDSVDFLRDYVAMFGNMPTELSVSAYDSTMALIMAIKAGGTTPDGIRSAILSLAKVKSLEGFFNPTLSNNDLSASVSVTVTNRYGAPELVARYEDTGRVKVLGPVPTTIPTPAGIVGTMKSDLNVRVGPGDNYQIIGQLKKDEQQPLIGASADFKWYVIDFRQQPGWIAAFYVSASSDVRSLPVIAPPPPAPPTATLFPSPTPQGVVGTMRSNVNVRSGPGDNYQVIGQLKKDEQQQLIGASADYKWYVIDFRQQQAWLLASLVSVFGDVRSLPVVAAPPPPLPTLTPFPTATPLPPATADLVMISAVMNPMVPTSGQPFILSVVIRNQGNRDAGAFAVATSFLPGDVYSAVNVAGLPAGTQTTVNLSGTVNGSGNFTIAIVIDLNNQVDEGANGKANNKPQFNYTVNP